jgi:hypothetical protein
MPCCLGSPAETSPRNHLKSVSGRRANRKLTLGPSIGFRCSKLSQPSGDVVEAFLAMIRNCGKRALRGMDRPKVSGGLWRELWSNHGPRIGANAYLIRFWEPPASRIFNQLPVTFTAVTRVQIPSGTPNSFSNLQLSCSFIWAQKRHNSCRQRGCTSLKNQ